MYRPIIEYREKILGSGGTSYPSYREPLVPLLCICSLWRPATSVKMNGYLRKLDRLFVWIFSIDRYLSWPYWTFISWDMANWQVLGSVGRWEGKSWIDSIKTNLTKKILAWLHLSYHGLTRCVWTKNPSFESSNFVLTFRVFRPRKKRIWHIKFKVGFLLVVLWTFKIRK